MYINCKYKSAYRYFTNDGTIEYCLKNKKKIITHEAKIDSLFIVLRPARSISVLFRMRRSLTIYKNYIEMREGMG